MPITLVPSKASKVGLIKADALVPPLAIGNIPVTSAEARSMEVPSVAVIEGDTFPTTVKAEHDTPVVHEAEEVATEPSLAGSVVLPVAVQYARLAGFIVGIEDVPTCAFTVCPFVITPPNRAEPAVKEVKLPPPHGEPIEVRSPEPIKAAQPADEVATVIEPAFKNVVEALRKEE